MNSYSGQNHKLQSHNEFNQLHTSKKTRAKSHKAPYRAHKAAANLSVRTSICSSAPVIVRVPYQAQEIRTAEGGEEEGKVARVPYQSTTR